MPTKAQILAGIARYYTTERGFVRSYFTGNKAVDWLGALLELPDFAELDGHAEISFSRVLEALERLDKNYREVYTPAFLAGTSKSSVLFRELFPTAAEDIRARPSLPVVIPPEASAEEIATLLKRLRDQLMFYCACIRRQPPIQSFFGGFIGASGYAGLERAEGYLVCINQALNNYRRRGVIDPPLLSEASRRRLQLGPHTREITTPRLNELMDVIRKLLNIDVNFTDRGEEGVYMGETMWLSRTNYSILLPNSDGSSRVEQTGSVNCYCSIKDFNQFLEDYLCKKEISFTSTGSTVLLNPSDFLREFNLHLDALERRAASFRAAKAAEMAQARENSIAAGAGM